MLDEKERLKKAGVTSINGVNYAVGLMWEPADDPENPRKEAYNMAKHEGVDANFICIRPSNPPQYGLGWKSVGHSANDRPLAHVVTENTRGSYIGAFKVDNKWWFGVSRNGVILPYGDAFYSTEDEAKEAMIKALGNISENDSYEKFAPASWGIEGAEDKALPLLLKNVSKLKLTVVETFVSRYKNIFAIIFIVIIGGYMFGNHYLEKMKVKKEIAISRTKAIDKAMQNVDNWKNYPEAGEFIDVCKEYINTLPMNIPGWDVSDVSCDGRTVKAGFTKNGGFIYDIENKAEQSGFNLSLNNDSSVGEMTKSIPMLMNRQQYSSGEELMSGREISKYFLDLSARIDVDVKLQGISTQLAQPRTLLDKDGNTVTIPPVYNQVKFSFGTGYPIEVWKDYLESFPGLYMESIKVNLEEDGLSWIVNGNVYQK